MKRQRTVPQAADGQRLDVALATLGGLSRNQAQQLLRRGAAQLNGQAAPARQVARAGDVITWQPVSPGAATAPKLPRLTILYEDADMVAIDKPPGLIVHGSGRQRVQPTVAAWAAAHGVADSDSERPGIVHRLDKDTSGVMVIAKHPAAKAALQRQFKQRTVVKTYVALVRGRLQPAAAIIRLPIGRYHRQPLKQRVLPGAREAVTEYRTQQTYAGATLVEVTLHTGRTHQIRVHFSHLGHPVMGDVTYGDAQRPAGLSRQFLHAAQLSLVAPSGRPLTITSSLPPDLRVFLAALKA